MCDMSKTKKCSKCESSKDSSEFYRNKGRKDGLSVYCIVCTKQYYDKPEWKEYEKKRNKKRSQTEDYKKYQVQYQIKLNKKKYNEDIEFKLRKRLSNLINKYLKKNGQTTNEIIGCTNIEFKSYIESKFLDGMTFENYGEWQLDHHIPQSSAKNVEELYKLNYYTNFKPMWKLDNLRKNNKISEEWGNA
jgi:hypothetical protein